MSRAGVRDCWTPLPGHNQVEYSGWVNEHGEYYVSYRGTPEALLAAGAATAAMLAPGVKGRRRRTDSGHRYNRWSDRAKGRLTLGYEQLPFQFAEGVLPGVPRGWRSVILPALNLSEQVSDPDLAPVGENS